MHPQFLIAREQLEFPQLDKEGTSVSDTAALGLHWSTTYLGKLDQWETFRVLAECLPPVCKDLFLEGLIGSRRMMSKECTLWWNITTLLSPLLYNLSPPKLLCCLCVLSLFLSQCAYSSLVVFSQILYVRGHFSWLKVCFFYIEGNIKQNKQPQENISQYFIIMHLG